MKKLLIIDGNAVLHRSFHALPPLTGKNGAVGAVFGFFSMLLKVLKEIKADFLAVCFDYPAPTFRHKQFIGYQIKRPKTDPSLSEQIEMTKEMVKQIGIPVFAKRGFEADDLIATIIKKIKNKKIETIILTGDRDLMQLVGEKVSLLMPIRGISETKIINPKRVRDYFGVKANQVVDYKALVGDTSDNYPGVPGVGPKTAAKLINRYSNLQGIYKNLEKIEPRLREKLENNKAAAELSYQLAKVVTNLSLPFHLKQAAWNQEKLANLAEVLKNYRFPSLLKRLENDFGFKTNAAQNQQMSLI